MRKGYQDAPSEDIENITDLRSILKDCEVIYVYPHHEIRLEDGQFRQTRSGPNWEGNVVTMTTCKHLMRTYSTIDRKVGSEVGFVGVTNKLEGENYILYAGVIYKRFDSNYDLGEYLRKNHKATYDIKLATNNRLGDIFEPYDADDKYEVLCFEDPTPDHCRAEENDSKGNPKWWKDISYESRSGVRPKCLTFNPVTVHTKPIYCWTGKLGRSGVVFKGDDAVAKFLDNIEMEL